MRIALISPHPDDIALSIGGLVARLEPADVLIITCFSRSCFTDSDEAGITGLRAAEDESYARDLGVGLVRLDLPDTNVRTGVGKRALDPDEEVRLRARLRAGLASLVEEWGLSTSFVPLAIGEHPDHVHCRDAAASLFDARALAFYEDLPYADMQGGPIAAARSAAANLPDYRGMIVPLSRADLGRKLERLAHYQCQIVTPWVEAVERHARAVGGRDGYAERCWAMFPLSDALAQPVIRLRARVEPPARVFAKGPDASRAPIIFIHYGDSYYLRYTLESAVAFNPDKQVILLGDHRNIHYGALGVYHIDYGRYAIGPEIELFDRVYQHIAGEKHGRHEWTRFVFRRWFLMHNFLRAHGLHRFWTFDSDTLILTRLSEYERKFGMCGCTEQCSGICMNGYVSDMSLVQGYVDKINELFQRESFLREQRAFLEDMPWYAFTEMNAYIKFREERGFQALRLGAVIDGETFLDSICTFEEHKSFLEDDQYELYDTLIWGHEVKKLFLRDDGEIFVRHRALGRMVKLNTINMSAVPDWLFDRLLRHAKRKLRRASAQRGVWSRIRTRLVPGARQSGIPAPSAAGASVLELLNDPGPAGVSELKLFQPTLVRRLLGIDLR